MATSIDIGTAFLVKAELDEVADGIVFTSERNCFLKASNLTDTEQTLKENNWRYVKVGEDFYILSEDAIKLKNLLSMKSNDDNRSIVVTKVGELRRPMKDGILNTNEDKLAVAIIQNLIGSLVGKAKFAGEVLCFCAPGDPVDNKLSVVFHRTILTTYLKSLGYTVECVPEALSIIYAERPVMDDPSEKDGISPFSGIAISGGGGMFNVCLSLKKMPLINFSVARAGDYIDKEAAKVAGIETSAMTRYKEQHLDLLKTDMSDLRQAALDIFYQNVIEHVLTNFAEKFNQLDTHIDHPLEIILAGGTCSIKGFKQKFEQVLSTLTLPFKIKSVRVAENPLTTVAKGLLLKAISMEKKSKIKEK